MSTSGMHRRPFEGRHLVSNVHDFHPFTVQNFVSSNTVPKEFLL